MNTSNTGSGSVPAISDQRGNPSAWHRRIPVIVLSLIGLVIATTLTLFQVDVLHSVWEPFFGDGSRRVLTSSFSEALPIPDASLGAVAYLLEAILESLGGTNRWRQQPWVVAAAGLVAAGLGLAALALIATQALVVGAFCTLCLASAAVSLTVAVLVAPEALAALRVLRERRRTALTAAHSDQPTSERTVYHTADQPGDHAAAVKDELLDQLADRPVGKPPGHPGDDLEELQNDSHESGRSGDVPGLHPQPRNPVDPERSRRPDGGPEQNY